jgi:hypothetical protein
LNKLREFLYLHLFLMPIVSGIAYLLIHLLLGLVGQGLGLHIVLVELILDHQVVSKALVEHLDLVVLGLQLVLLPLVDFENFLQLQLQEGHIVTGLVLREAWVAISIRHFHMVTETVRET